MSHDHSVALSDHTWQLLQQQSAITGTAPQQIVETAVQEHIARRRPARKRKEDMTEEEKVESRRRFERHFGAVDLGYPTGADNESIDADLAREYDNNHENG